MSVQSPIAAASLFPFTTREVTNQNGAFVDVNFYGNDAILTAAVEGSCFS
jgi:hypothetical protein